MRKIYLTCVCSYLFFQPLSAWAYAQTNVNIIAPAENISSNQNGTIIYRPEYFAEFNPTTAADMVAHIPGFSIQDGDNVRGLAGALGNVLIDNSRPSSKDQGLNSILSTIDASSIDHIEILQGEALGSLGGGHAMLVNVVRKTDDVNQSSLTLYINAEHNGFVFPNLTFNTTNKILGFNVATNIEYGLYDFSKRYGEDVLNSANGNIIEFGPNFSKAKTNHTKFTTTIDGNILGLKTNINFLAADNRFQRNWNYNAFSGNGIDNIRYDDGIDFSHSYNYELGGSFERKILGFDADLNFIAKHEYDDEHYDAGFNVINATSPSHARFAPQSTSVEGVIQGSLAKKYGNHAISFGGETGITRLDRKSSFYIDNGQGYVRQSNGDAATIIEERRTEAFIADTWSIRSNLSIEARLRSEWSNITQTGDANRERSFVYLKPRVAINWQVRNNLNIRASYEHILGQLDLEDFAFQASLDEGNQHQGNENLRPDQTDEYKLEIEKKWGEHGVVTISFLEQQKADVVTSIPIYFGTNYIGDTTGNVPYAHRWGIELDTTIPLFSVAQGLQLNIEYRYRNSDISDPYTGQTRQMAIYEEKRFYIGIEQNIESKKLSWGAFYKRGDNNRDYNYDQNYTWPSSTWTGAYIEYKGIRNTTINAEIDNPFGMQVSRIRHDYLISRADGNISQIHGRHRNISPSFSLSIRRNL